MTAEIRTESLSSEDIPEGYHRGKSPRLQLSCDSEPVHSLTRSLRQRVLRQVHSAHLPYSARSQTAFGWRWMPHAIEGHEMKVSSAMMTDAL